MPDEVDKAKEYAFTLLGFRPYSVKELRQRLRQKGFSTEVANQVIRIMEEHGYLDDEAYARRWVEILLQRRGFGCQRLLQELVARGIERRLAERVLAELPPEGEFERAKSLAQKKLRSFSKRDPGKTYQYLARYLIRQGFTPEISRKVLEEVLSPREW